MFSELGGPESFTPGEGGAAASEQLSEEARQRFAASAAAQQQAQKDEKKAKRRDDGVAQMILQFLTDSQRTHLATLISRLVARDCPSIFLLSILSLINDDCRKVVDTYLSEKLGEEQATALQRASAELATAGNPELVPWIERMQQILYLEHDHILPALVVEEGNIDGTVLQLTSFVLQEQLNTQGKDAPFDKLQVLTAGILQALFQPYAEHLQQHLLAKQGPVETED